jgi:uncharacterized phage infection (PIP) family protein YhgE
MAHFPLIKIEINILYKLYIILFSTVTFKMSDQESSPTGFEQFQEALASMNHLTSMQIQSIFSQIQPLLNQFPYLIGQIMHQQQQLQQIQQQTQDQTLKTQEIQDQLKETHGQLQETRGQLQETRRQLRETHRQLQETRGQLRETHRQLQEKRGQLQKKQVQSPYNKPIVKLKNPLNNDDRMIEYYFNTSPGKSYLPIPKMENFTSEQLCSFFPREIKQMFSGEMGDDLVGLRKQIMNRMSQRQSRLKRIAKRTSHAECEESAKRTPHAEESIVSKKTIVVNGIQMGEYADAESAAADASYSR